MKQIMIVIVLVFTPLLVKAQVNKEMGTFTPNSTTIEKTHFDKTLKLSYVANAERIQEFENYVLVDELIVVSVSFQADRIKYEVVNKSGNSFTLTFGIKNRVLLMSNSTGDYRRVSGAGLSFTHQY